MQVQGQFIVFLETVSVSLPLYGFVQLIDDGLKYSLMGSDVRTVETGSEERHGCTFSVTPWLQAHSQKHTHARIYKHRNTLQLFTHNTHELDIWHEASERTHLLYVTTLRRN